MNVCVLSGGFGGAKFVRALVETLGGPSVTAIVNVGDDIDILGVHVSPDLDSVVYALAGLADEERGWGRAGETWNALETVSQLGGDDWFKLGDRDLGLHLLRTQALRDGEPLSSFTTRVSRTLGIEAAVLPATDDELRTFVATPAGTFSFQEWFVARGHRDDVDAVDVRGDARPAPGVIDALASADLLLIAPSNPYVSIGPILAVREIRDALEARRVPCVAVSPLVGGRAVKGPADRMLARLAGGTTPAHVASCYPGLIDALVVDEEDDVAGARRPADRDADADDRRGLAAARRGSRALGSRMRVAILGGTGKFGRALAIRLAAAGDDVVIGSRDPERAREIAAKLGVRGARNDDVGDVDLVVLAVEAGAALSTVRGLKLQAPLLSVAAEVAFEGGSRTTRQRRPVARRASRRSGERAGRRGAALARRVRAGGVSARAGRPGLRRRPGGEAARARARRKDRATGARSTQARWRPRARWRR